MSLKKAKFYTVDQRIEKKFRDPMKSRHYDEYPSHFKCAGFIPPQKRIVKETIGQKRQKLLKELDSITRQDNTSIVKDTRRSKNDLILEGLMLGEKKEESILPEDEESSILKFDSFSSF